MNVGDHIGDYEVVEILGSGGMGQVYKVRNTLSERMEAMKVLLPNLESDPGLADRFLREIKVQAALNHPNIAKLYTAMRAGNQLLMLMELVDGVAVSKRLESGPMSSAEAAGVAAGVLDALAYAHAQGVVHRDIKPANIMLTTSGGVKLMDFGIARMQADKRLTQTGGAVGSLFYMSPEQIRGVEPDPRSDVYSLGITLYEMVTGRRPFSGDSDYQIMSAHLQQIPQPPTELEPGIASDLSEIILTAIAKDPAARFQSAGAFRAALAGLLPEAAAAPAMVTLHPPPVPIPGLAGPPPPLPPPIPAHVQSPIAATPSAASRPVAPPLPAPPLPAPPAPVVAPVQKSNRALYMAIGSVATVALLVAAGIEGPKLFHGGPSAASDASAPAASAPPASGTPVPSPGAPAPSNAEPNRTADGPPSSAGSPPAVRSAVSPVNASPAPQPSSPPQQRPATPTVQQSVTPVPPPAAPPQATPAPPDREYSQLREQFNELSIRANSASAGLRSFEQQQSRQGLGLRADIREAKTRLDYQLQEAMTRLQSGDYDGTRQSMRYAQSAVETIEKFLGR